MYALSIAFELIFSYESKSNKPRLDFAFVSLDCIVFNILLFLSRHKTAIDPSHKNPDRKELK